MIGYSCLLYAGAASASTYYVSNRGNDLRSGESVETAWRTLAKVSASSFRPGDRILFDAGSTWNETLTVPSSGAEGAPIIFASYGAGHPTINGADHRYGIVLASRSYIVIDGFKITGQSKSGILAYQRSSNANGNRLQNEYITVKNVLLEGIGDREGDDTYYGQGGIFVRGMDAPGQLPLRGWLIEDVDCGRMNVAPVLNYNAACLQIQSTTGARVTRSHVHSEHAMGLQFRPFFNDPACDSNEADHNTFDHNQGNITAWGAGSIVTDNVIHESSGFGIQLGPDGKGLRNQITQLSASADGTLYNGIDINDARSVELSGNRISQVAGCSITLEGSSPGATLMNNELDSTKNLASTPGASPGSSGCIYYIMTTSLRGLVIGPNIYHQSATSARSFGFGMAGPTDEAHRFTLPRFQEQLKRQGPTLH